ncbi:unnamed protein product [Dibothriocephalus latus]|uniref:Uncharacterized protein n=1 Tax=Dibothriocephalus latus TaxID=60516 RepID=A0A3P6PMT3_DIBLA|nr:unnamed protein product [Dibothriocephalus latus]
MFEDNSTLFEIKEVGVYGLCMHDTCLIFT